MPRPLQSEKHKRAQSGGTYEIRVKGHLEERYSERLGGMSIHPFQLEGLQVTLLLGRLPDDSALAGVLNELFELQLSLISVERLEG